MIACPICGHQQAATAPYCARCGRLPLPGLGTGNLAPNVTLQGGGYVILQTVGRASMGAVYKAADTRQGGKVVAIKELSAAGLPSAANATDRRRLQGSSPFRHCIT